VEGPGEVFSGGEVDAGFAAEAAIDHCKQCGGHLHQRHSAHVACGCHAGGITDGTATEGDDDAFAVHAVLGHFFDDVADNVPGFAGLAIGNEDVMPLERGIVEAAGKGVSVQFPDRLRGDNSEFFRAKFLFEGVAQLGGDVLPDDDVRAETSGVDVPLMHGGSLLFCGRASS